MDDEQKVKIVAIVASILTVSCIQKAKEVEETRKRAVEEEEELFLFLTARRNVRRRRIKHVRIQGYVEEVVPRYSANEFKKHFRMNKETFERVLEAFANHGELPQAVNRGGRPPVSVLKQLLLALWLLGNQESFRSVADRFDVAESCAHTYLRRVCKALKNMAHLFIVWPKGEKARNVMAGFEGIGAIDGCHIPIKAPRICPENYINRKGFHSLVLQAVADNELIFTDCYVGWPGSVHDARVLGNSDLFSSHEEKFQGDTFVLGDSAYPLKTWLMTPCKDYGNLTGPQKNYNYFHSSTRMVVERSFALLKGRFRKLKYMDMNVEHIPEAVIAACVLHNLCLIQGDELDGYLEPVEEEVNHFQNFFLNDGRAQQKREDLIYYLQQH